MPAGLQRLVHDLGTTVLMAEHRLERVVQYADRVLLLPSPGEAPLLGTPAEIMAVSPVHPPVVSLGRLAGWTPLPLSIRDARRLSGPLKSRLPSLLRPGLSGAPGVAAAREEPGAARPVRSNAARAGSAQRIPAPPAFEARGSGGGAPRGSGAQPRGTGEGRVGDQPRAAAPAPAGPAPAPAGTATGPLARLRRLAGRRPKPQGAGPAGPADAPAASARNLGVRRARTEVLHDVTLQVAPGETVALMGRNGAGKSTLLAALTGTLAPSTGQVTVGGRTPHRTPPPEMVRRVGLVPQEPRDLLYADTVAAECAAADADAGAAPGTCRALVGDLLPGVPDDTHPRDLSEGQRLTLALALVLTARPALLLLDEPTRGLDYAAKARLVATLRGLAADGHAIVLATHDVELAAELAHRVVILAGGEIVADGPTAEVVVSSPAFAPQVAKILAPGHWLTVSQVAAALETTP
ncbi:ATP-binding cassette domain-containing protein [Streptomyces sp. C]|uniref:energy-coupling factor ABC transporter ATP-binding protein n=1 Tax=Streptomyces sp. C TaxID=253839 RepID=UPI001F504A53|nr:ATP-binding cassette domain-containing protein [Streptomyces sp. C]